MVLTNTHAHPQNGPLIKPRAGLEVQEARAGLEVQEAHSEVQEEHEAEEQD